jgi:hypothetical protein
MESVGQAVNSLDKDPDLLYSLAEWLNLSTGISHRSQPNG